MILAYHCLAKGQVYDDVGVTSADCAFVCDVASQPATTVSTETDSAKANSRKYGDMIGGWQNRNGFDYLTARQCRALALYGVTMGADGCHGCCR